MKKNAIICGSTVWRTNRFHQHLIIGQEAVDGDVYFKALRDVSYDGTMSTPVYGWDEKTVEIARNTLEQNNLFRQVLGESERLIEILGYAWQDDWRSWIEPSDRPQQHLKGDIYRESNDSSRTQPAYEAAGSGDTRAWP